MKKFFAKFWILADEPTSVKFAKRLLT